MERSIYLLFALLSLTKCFSNKELLNVRLSSDYHKGERNKYFILCEKNINKCYKTYIDLESNNTFCPDREVERNQFYFSPDNKLTEQKSFCVFGLSFSSFNTNTLDIFQKSEHNLLFFTSFTLSKQELIFQNQLNNENILKCSISLTNSWGCALKSISIKKNNIVLQTNANAIFRTSSNFLIFPEILSEIFFFFYSYLHTEDETCEKIKNLKEKITTIVCNKVTYFNDIFFNFSPDSSNEIFLTAQELFEYDSLNEKYNFMISLNDDKNDQNLYLGNSFISNYVIEFSKRDKTVAFIRSSHGIKDENEKALEVVIKCIESFLPNLILLFSFFVYAILMFFLRKSPKKINRRSFEYSLSIELLDK